MKHASEETIEELEPFRRKLRAVPGLVERRPGAFSRKSKAFLHFHEDPTGLYADVRLDDDFERVRVTTDAEQRELLGRIRSL